MDAALIGAIAGLVGVWLGQWLVRDGEYRKWLRAERHRACTGVLVVVERARYEFDSEYWTRLAVARGQVGSDPTDETEVHAPKPVDRAVRDLALVEQMLTAMGTLDLVCPHTVVSAARELMLAVWKPGTPKDGARRDLERAVRKPLQRFLAEARRSIEPPGWGDHMATAMRWFQRGR